MAAHLYEIGDTVSVNFHQGEFFSKWNPFIIEAQLPPLGAFLQYRVKSKAEACRRVVTEHQLSPFGAEPETPPVISLDSGLHETR
ncbi:MAG TPA: hypothetical protein VH414_08165 [Lichenihabitans sp.]|jgi:hypothetical protein|nr:hypothetical protein [Lichenihabitans sp.]